MTIFPLDCRDSCSAYTMRDNAKSSAFSLYLPEIAMHMTYARGQFPSTLFFSAFQLRHHAITIIIVNKHTF